MTARRNALAAIVEWMGAYEDYTGNPIGDTLDRQDRSHDARFAEDFEVPLDIVQGYRLAVETLRQYDEDALVRIVMRRNPHATAAQARAVVRALPKS